MIIKPNGDRVRPSADLTLEPVRGRALPPYSFLSRDIASARGRARNQLVRPMRAPDLGGALLYWNADDAIAEGGSVRWRNRVSSRYDLIPATGMGAGVSIVDTFTSTQPERAVQFVSNGTAGLTIGNRLAGVVDSLATFEVVIVLNQTAPSTGSIFSTATFAPPGPGVAWLRAVPGQIDAFGANGQVKKMVDTVADRVSILHFLSVDGGVELYVNGIKLGVETGAAGAGVPTTFETFTIGADNDAVGAPGAAEMRVREVALYPRALTTTERRALFAGYYGNRLPVLDDVLSQGSNWISWYPERGIMQIAAGAIVKADNVPVISGTPAVGLDNSGRKVVDLNNAVFLDAVRSFTGSAHTWIAGFREPAANTTILTPTTDAGSSEGLRLNGTGRIEATANGATATLAAAGDVRSRRVAAFARSAAGTLTLEAAQFFDGAGSYAAGATSTASTAASRTKRFRFGGDNAGARLSSASIFFAILTDRDFTANEKLAIWEYMFNEHNNFSSFFVTVSGDQVTVGGDPVTITIL